MLILAVLLVLGTTAAQAEEAEATTILRGNVDITAVDSEDNVGFEAEQQGAVTLRGDRFWIGQLRDPKLKSRLWEIEARLAEPGVYDIVVAYTVKDGERFRVTYYCDICHIRTHDPGRCMCCQEETVLQELPAAEFGTL